MAIFLILKLEHINARVQSFSFPSPFQNTIIIRIVVRYNSLLRMLGAEKWLMRQGKYKCTCPLTGVLFTDHDPRGCRVN